MSKEIEDMKVEAARRDTEDDALMEEFLKLSDVERALLGGNPARIMIALMQIKGYRKQATS